MSKIISSLALLTLIPLSARQNVIYKDYEIGAIWRSHFTQLAIVKTQKISFWRSPKTKKLIFEGILAIAKIPKAILQSI